MIRPGAMTDLGIRTSPWCSSSCAPGEILLADKPPTGSLSRLLIGRNLPTIAIVADHHVLVSTHVPLDLCEKRHLQHLHRPDERQRLVPVRPPGHQHGEVPAHADAVPCGPQSDQVRQQHWANRDLQRVINVERVYYHDLVLAARPCIVLAARWIGRATASSAPGRSDSCRRRSAESDAAPCEASGLLSAFVSRHLDEPAKTSDRTLYVRH